VQPWNFGKLPELFGGGHAFAVETAGELDDALAKARVRDGQLSIVEVRLDRTDVSQALVRLGARLKAEASAGRPEPVAATTGRGS